MSSEVHLDAPRMGQPESADARTGAHRCSWEVEEVGDAAGPHEQVALLGPATVAWSDGGPVRADSYHPLGWVARPVRQPRPGNANRDVEGVTRRGGPHAQPVSKVTADRAHRVQRPFPGARPVKPDGGSGLDRWAGRRGAGWAGRHAAPSLVPMSDAYAPAVGAGIGSTALGRLQMRVPDEGGFEDVVIERRWPDMAAARAWCERTLARAAVGTTVLEVQVFEESWKHAKSWETTRHRPVAEVLQLAVVTVDGTLRWAEPRSMTPRAGARHLL